MRTIPTVTLMSLMLPSLAIAQPHPTFEAASVSQIKKAAALTFAAGRDD
jgi:hypothetical protein